MKHQKTVSRILDGLILLVFILFFSSAGFQDRNTSGWYQQWFPNLNGSTITDITFLDSLTGFAVTNPGTSIYCYILKTTNGGDNWVINYTYNSGANIKFTRIQFADNNTGYVSTNFYNFFKTTDSGLTWTDYPNVPFGAEDMSVVNRDSILVVTSSGFGGGVYRSTNGGVSWTRIWTNGTSGNPDKIYMYDKNLGFSCTGNSSSSIFYRTNDGGLNWSNLGDSTFRGIQFFDSFIGWKQTRSSVKKTTNGGLTWSRQTTPSFFYTGLYDLSIVNKDTVWYVGSATLINNFPYGVICKTTNGGLNWGYQLPDTSIRISEYVSLDFINRDNGWAYQVSTGVHTKTGGNDTTIFTSINNTNTEITDFRLFQNYPNPFNTRTVIRYIVTGSPIRTFGDDKIMLKVYDINGREAATLVNRKMNPGMYEAVFDGSEYSSGIYFYSLIIGGKAIDTKRMIMVK